jgi:hypothetical protein
MLTNSIHSTIDFEKSREEGRIVLREGVSQELDELKVTYASLDDFLVCTNAAIIIS